MRVRSKRPRRRSEHIGPGRVGPGRGLRHSDSPIWTSPVIDGRAGGSSFPPPSGAVRLGRRSRGRDPGGRRSGESGRVASCSRVHHDDHPHAQPPGFPPRLGDEPRAAPLLRALRPHAGRRDPGQERPAAARADRRRRPGLRRCPRRLAPRRFPGRLRRRPEPRRKGQAGPAHRQGEVRRLRGLPQAPRPQGYRRRDHRHARPLAHQDLHRRHARGQGHLLREAADPDDRRGEEAGPGRQGDQARGAGRHPAAERPQPRVPAGRGDGPRRPDRQDPEGHGGHRRRADRRPVPRDRAPPRAELGHVAGPGAEYALPRASLP